MTREEAHADVKNIRMAIGLEISRDFTEEDLQSAFVQYVVPVLEGIVAEFPAIWRSHLRTEAFRLIDIQSQGGADPRLGKLAKLCFDHLTVVGDHRP